MPISLSELETCLKIFECNGFFISYFTITLQHIFIIHTRSPSSFQLWPTNIVPLLALGHTWYHEWEEGKVIPLIELCAGNKIYYELIQWYVKYVNGTLAKDPLPMQNDVPSRTFYLGKWRLQWPIWLPNLSVDLKSKK